jgi:hypothetical protein
MVVALGSMAIKGVFKAGSLLSGLGKTSSKLKEVKQRGKSTTTEMKRMTGQTHLLSKAMAAIGVAGFSALLMTTPQLAGSLAKIKHEMTMLAWSIGKHLKPALDAVATILRGIRTGDWSTVKQGIEDLTTAVVNLIAKAGTFVIDLVFGEGTAAKVADDFQRWWEKINKAYEEGNLFVFMLAAIEPVIWALERLWDVGIKIGNWLKTDAGKFATGKMMIQSIPGGSALMELFGFYARGGGYGRSTKTTTDKKGYQTGGLVPRTGLYKLHAGETVTMQGSSPHEGAGGPTSITLDFSGANINLASGIELNDFAEVISNKIAERQHSLTY